MWGLEGRVVKAWGLEGRVVDRVRDQRGRVIRA